MQVRTPPGEGGPRLAANPGGVYLVRFFLSFLSSTLILLMEAEPGHVALDDSTVKRLRAVTLARLELGSLLLTLQDGDAVVAARRAAMENTQQNTAA